MSTDRIEKRVLLGAPRSRVWRALTDTREFGHWFGVRFESPSAAFQPHTAIHGVIVTTAVDPEFAKLQKPFEGKPFHIVVDRIEPESRFSFQWHPFGVEEGIDYSAEPMTLVEFVLEDRGDQTMLTITESGFDRIPLSRRARAFQANEGGWTGVLRLIEKHLSHAS
jgi:uncharacterized protein YndB with AHSA1/START domain